MQLLWKEGVKPSGIHCQLPAVFLERETAHAGNTTLELVWSFSSGKETVQVAVRDRY